MYAIVGLLKFNSKSLYQLYNLYQLHFRVDKVMLFR